MGPETKQNALTKLHAIVNKIGYPDKWRDYTSVAISRDDFSGNAERAAVFESKRRLNKIGKPVDRGEWSMTPPTVNAYYSSRMNDINFPQAYCNLLFTTRRWTTRLTTATPAEPSVTS